MMVTHEKEQHASKERGYWKLRITIFALVATWVCGILLVIALYLFPDVLLPRIEENTVHIPEEYVQHSLPEQPIPVLELQEKHEMAFNRGTPLGNEGEGRVGKDVQAQSNTVHPDYNALWVAIVQLQDAVVKGGEVGQGYMALKKAAHSMPALQNEIEKLAPYSEGRVYSLEQLRREFGSLIEDILRAARNEGAPLSFFDRIARYFPHMVSIRKVGADSEGEGVDAIIARAEHALEEGILDEAVKEMRRLKDKPAVLATPWVKKAETTYHVGKAMEEIVRYVASAERE